MAGHAHPEVAVYIEINHMKTIKSKINIKLEEDIDRRNRIKSQKIRSIFDKNGITAIDIMGSVGTGKTTLIKGIAQEIDVPIILFDLASMSNTEFNKYWNQAKSYGPCIVVFEDFDSVFSKRKNILGHAGGGLSFDSILNCLSGVDEANGVFLVVTTNKIEEIDEALGVPIDSEAIISSSSRPGRIDKTIKFGAMGEKEKNVIANKMLKDIDDINIEEIIKGTEDYTAAQFKEKCTEIALRHYWDNESIIGEIDEEKESIKRKAV